MFGGSHQPGFTIPGDFRVGGYLYITGGGIARRSPTSGPRHMDHISSIMVTLWGRLSLLYQDMSLAIFLLAILMRQGSGLLAKVSTQLMEPGGKHLLMNMEFGLRLPLLMILVTIVL